MRLVADSGGERLDRFLAGRLPEYTREHLKSLIRDGLVKVSGAACKPSRLLRPGEAVEIEFPGVARAGSSSFEDWVLHEDGQLIVIDKPAGLLMHPLGTSWLTAPEAALAGPENLAGILLKARPGRAPRCGIVHRLDRQTSGVLLIAKTEKAYELLVEAFKERRIGKTYGAVARGQAERGRVSLVAPVGRKPGHRLVAVTPFGKEARTEFKVLKTCARASLVEAKPLSGRTHQIRAHLAHLGHPVAGDPDFDLPGAVPAPPRLMLHARRIEFAHPAGGRRIRFEAAWPADFRGFWKECERA